MEFRNSVSVKGVGALNIALTDTRRMKAETVKVVIAHQRSANWPVTGSTILSTAQIFTG